MDNFIWKTENRIVSYRKYKTMRYHTLNDAELKNNVLIIDKPIRGDKEHFGWWTTLERYKYIADNNTICIFKIKLKTCKQQ